MRRESSGGVCEGCCGIVIPCEILLLVQVLSEMWNQVCGAGREEHGAALPRWGTAPWACQRAWLIQLCQDAWTQGLTSSGEQCSQRCGGTGLNREKSCGRGVTTSLAPLGRRVPHPVCHWESLGAEMWQQSHSCLKPRPRPGCRGGDRKGMCCSLPWPLSLVMAFLSRRNVLKIETRKALEGGCPCRTLILAGPLSLQDHSPHVHDSGQRHRSAFKKCFL